MRRIFEVTAACAALLSTAPPAAAGANGQETVKYEYDALGRLVKVNNTDGPNKGTVTTYTLDKAGNRTNVKVEGAHPRVVVVPLNGFTVIPLR